MLSKVLICVPPNDVKMGIIIYIDNNAVVRAQCLCNILGLNNDVSGQKGHRLYSDCCSILSYSTFTLNSLLMFMISVR